HTGEADCARSGPCWGRQTRSEERPPHRTCPTTPPWRRFALRGSTLHRHETALRGPRRSRSTNPGSESAFRCYVLDTKTSQTTFLHRVRHRDFDSDLTLEIDLPRVRDGPRLDFRNHARQSLSRRRKSFGILLTRRKLSRFGR